MKVQKPTLQRRVSEAERRKEGVGDSNHTKRNIRNGLIFQLCSAAAMPAGLQLSFMIAAANQVCAAAAAAVAAPCASRSAFINTK
ncbi:hypothetical protein MmiHf6_03130 [Methanimicrococcus hongohii]|uniref:Uncharacterized protein n=1 Tax=Methanimicrococcus hongohii TaxID=3028295 RepID=A0AA96ZTS6_9EURY|nr:hypothetical protein [Methanimicrococcus sp. Hf6]WNY23017.1 hypothetical protein MmiHf6_03130 [Methanimicrococcus sp. Hf6]